MTPTAAPTVFAHRGFAGQYPENTVLAVERAGRSPDAEWVELDVLPTAEGDPVVFHDLALDEKTDRSGVVFETPTSDVTSAAVLGSGEPVPALDDALAACDRAGLDLNLELKNPGSFDVRPDERLRGDALDDARKRWTPFVERVLAALDGFGRDVLCSSFCAAPLAVVADVSRHDTAVITADPAVGLDVARDHGCVAVHPALATVTDPGGAAGDGDGNGNGNGNGTGDAGATDDDDDASTDGAVVAAAHDAGLAVNAWTVRTWHEAAQLRAAGVDGVIADYPGLGSALEPS